MPISILITAIIPLEVIQMLHNAMRGGGHMDKQISVMKVYGSRSFSVTMGWVSNFQNKVLHNN